MAEPRCGAGPVGVVWIIGDLGLPARGLEIITKMLKRLHTFAALLSPWLIQGRSNMEVEVSKEDLQ
jgi:hypothetical protein